MKLNNSIPSIIAVLLCFLVVSLFFLSEDKEGLGTESLEVHSSQTLTFSEKSSYRAAPEIKGFKAEKKVQVLELVGTSNPKPVQSFLHSANPLDEFQFSKAMSLLNECLDTQACVEFKRGDSRNYYYEVVFNKKSFIKKMYKLIRKNPSFMTEEIYQRVLKLMYEDEDHIRFAAIEVLDLYPVSQEALESITHALEVTISEKLVERGLAYIKAKGAAQSPEVVKTVLKQIYTGSQETSQFMAKKSFVFMTEENLSEFIALLKKLDPSSKNHKLLKSNIQEFIRYRRLA